MPTSVRGLIGANLKTTLLTVQAANGYANSVQAVFRGLVAPENQPGPYLSILALKQPYEQLAFPLITRKAMYQIVGEIECPRVDDGPEKAEVLDEFLADVEKALLADITRGGLAVTTDLVDVDFVDADAADAWGLFILNVRVHYRTKRFDPFTKA